MKKIFLLLTIILSIICYSQYISADEEYYRTENNGNGIGQGGNGNGNGGAGNGNGNGNAVPTTNAPIDSHIGLIGIFIAFSYIIIIQNRKKQKQ